MPHPKPSLKDLLARFAEGEEVDFGAADPIDAKELSGLIQAVASEPLGPTVLALHNARIKGDLRLNTVGHVRPIALTFQKCDLEGIFIGRQSAWRQLTFFKSRLRGVDLAETRVDTGLLIEGCNGLWLSAPWARIGGAFSIAGTHFAGSPTPDDPTIRLSDINVGGHLEAWNIVCDGRFMARRAHVSGDFLLKGAKLAAAKTEPVGLVLTGSEIRGNLDLSESNNERFHSYALLEITDAQIGGLYARGALIEPRPGTPALIADRTNFRGPVSLSGNKDGARFIARGQIRMIGALFGGQVEFHGADICGEAGQPSAIILDNSSIGADLLFGTEQSTLRVDGRCSVTKATVRGRILIAGAEFRSREMDAFAVRQSRIDGEIEIHKSKFFGAVFLDQCTFDGLSGEAWSVERAKGVGVRVDRPAHYADENDALLDLNHSIIRQDIHLTHVTLTGGDLRLFGAVIEHGIQLFGFSVLEAPGLAISGQGARIGGGLMIAGTPGKPALLQGDLGFHSVVVAQDVTLLNVEVGSDSRTAKTSFAAASIGGTLVAEGSTFHGKFEAVGAKVGGGLELRNDTAVLAGPDRAVALDRAVIGGSVHLQGVFRGPVGLMGAKITGVLQIHRAHIDGLGDTALDMEGAEVAEAFLFIERASAVGGIDAVGAEIGGNFVLHGSTIRSERHALRLQNARIQGGLFLQSTATEEVEHQGRIEGLVDADGCFASSLNLNGLVLGPGSELRLTNMNIARQAAFTYLRPEGSLKLSLAGTTAGTIVDRIEQKVDGWGGSQTTLDLDGFVYGSLENASGGHGETVGAIRKWRKVWLGRRGQKKSSQPGHQLAKTLSSQGYFDAARLVAMDTHRAAGRRTRNPLALIASEIFGLGFGHGFSGGRSFLALVVYWAVGLAGVTYLEGRHLLVRPLDDDASTSQTKACGSEFNPPVFAADLMIPLLDLHQGELCRVGKGPGAQTRQSIALPIIRQTVKMDEVRFWQVISALYEAMGWLVVSLAIATWSGIFRRGGRE